IELGLEGELDRQWIDEGRASYQTSVQRRLAGLATMSAEESGPRPLSVEDALGLRGLAGPERTRLQEARQALCADKPQEAARALSGLPESVPAVTWARAYLSLLRDDAGL